MSLRQICDVRSLNDPSPGCPRQSSEWFLDSPAGVPDGSGALYYPEQVLANQPQSGGYLQEISPDIYRAVAFPINPAVAAGIQFQIGAGELPPPPPRYCRVTPAQASIAVGAQEQIFVAGPSTSQSDAVRAEQWAQQNNIAFLPTIECWDGVFATGTGWGAPIVTAVITSPANGQIISGVLNVVGTVQFDPSQAEFWHLDVIGGEWGDWVPMGTPGYTSMVNQVLFSGVLPPGNYRIRLRLVKDGNFLQQPYEVAFTVQ
jgi:hypothetical protein